ncbi:MAG: hypothetical protein KDK10_15035 [Maritimibacter sp.]|nr:hypothetical protein [Maritimibacter sp.]
MKPIVWAVILSAWAAQAGAQEAPAAETVPETEPACAAAGGRWERAGLARQTLCILPTADAGQACETAADCSGFCLAETGTCSAEAPIFGCFDVKDLDGATLTLCVD